MSLKNILKTMLLVVVFACGFVSGGCAHTGDGFGHLVKATGSATISLGSGVGKLLDGVGEDIIDASNKQLEHNKNEH